MSHFREVIKLAQYGPYPEQLWGFSLDTPCAPFTESTLDVRGWLLARNEPARALIEVCDAKGRVLQKSKAEQKRPDVALHYPHAPYAEQCGFSLRIDTNKGNPHDVLHVRVVLHDGQYLVLGGIEYRRRAALSEELPPHLQQRQPGYALLSGRGIEIGALNQPANLPEHCKVEYCDVASSEESARHFQEIDPGGLVKVDHICDVDREALPFSDACLDFAVINHVLEHVANPIQTLERVFQVVKPGGYVVLSIPDKDFTFDKPRKLTTFEHLAKEYQTGVTEVSDEHYLDFLRALRPGLFEKDKNQELAGALEKVRERREHAHVWDSQSFAEFLARALELLKIKAEPVFVSKGGENHFEYFAVWRKI